MIIEEQASLVQSKLLNSCSEDEAGLFENVNLVPNFITINKM